MEQFRYLVNSGQSLTRWRLGEVQSFPFDSPPECFDAPVNTHEAYVQIVYPVRKHFLASHDLSTIPLPQGPFDRIHFPFECSRVDFTTFIHTPHHLWVRGVSWIDAPETGSYPFDVYTCGGIKLWVNGEEALCFAPFTRNIAGKTRVSFPLNKGLNELKVYADELAERDVFFYFELRYAGSLQVEGVLFVERGAGEIAEAEAFLLSCYFPRDCITEGDILLYYDLNLATGDRLLFLDDQGGRLPFPGAGKQMIARKGTDHVCIGSASNSAGIYKLRIGTEAGGHSIYRELLLGLKPAPVQALEAGPDIKARKSRALDFIAGYGERTITGALAICGSTGMLTAEAETYIRADLAKVDAMEDCADFILVPLCWLITRYRALVPYLLHEEIRRVILKFRYWIDEPGNDVMWYFSENHAFLFHCAQYLTGALFGEAVFSAGGKYGREQSEKGKERLVNWFTLFFKYGYAEWNSATYIPVDLIGFFTLYETAPDESIKKMAQDALDYTFKIMTYNSFKGIMSSSYGRAYEATLKYREQLETCLIEWIAYGSGFINHHTRASVLFALSSYEPPRYDKDIQTGADGWMLTVLDQGIRRVKTYAYRTADFFTASVRRFRPFTHGHQQHLMNVALGNTGVQYYINHPGEQAFSGGNRPSYWAGNGTMPYIEQYRDLTAMIFNIDPEEPVHYIHAYTVFYDYDEYETGAQWLFIRVDNAYCATWFSNGYRTVSYGANTGKEVISTGLNHGVIVRCGSAGEWGTFRKFTAAMKSCEVSYDGSRALSFRDPLHGLLRISAPDTAVLNETELDFSEKNEMEVVRGTLRQGAPASGL
ncbi:MAG: hypothetical protein LBP76_02010 [Treponema sp.]|jgi:hypothetical protein|nr:hypothetical protein [Treponema sp.]